MSLRRIVVVLTSVVARPRPMLGRWLIERDVQKLDRKFDQANEDHCGCCEQVRKVDQQIDIENDYFLPFIV